MKNKITLLAILLALTGCKTEGDHAIEAMTLFKQADLFCSCRDGVIQFEISRYSSLADQGFVYCRNGARASVNDIVFTCGKGL